MKASVTVKSPNKFRKEEQLYIQHFQSLDVWKGLSILCILITHFNWSNHSRLVLLFPFWVDMAVPVFMMISGYLYAVSLERQHMVALEDAYRNVFVVRKLVRYAVPFAFAWLFELVYDHAVRHAEISVGGAIRQFITGGSGPGSFYFPVLIQLIFLMPLIYYFIKKAPLKGLFGCFVINLVYEITQFSYGLNENTYRLLIFRYIFLLGVGCYLYVAGADALFANRKRCWMSAGCMAVGILYIIINSYTPYGIPFINYWTSTCLIAALFIFPIFALTLRKSRGGGNRFFELLGRSSYEIFLTQMGFYLFFAQYVYAAISLRILQLLACMGISLVIGLLFHLVMDRWVMKFCFAVTQRGAEWFSKKWDAFWANRVE